MIPTFVMEGFGGFVSLPRLLKARFLLMREKNSITVVCPVGLDHSGLETRFWQSSAPQLAQTCLFDAQAQLRQRAFGPLQPQHSFSFSFCRNSAIPELLELIFYSLEIYSKERTIKEICGRSPVPSSV